MLFWICFLGFACGCIKLPTLYERVFWSFFILSSILMIIIIVITCLINLSERNGHLRNLRQAIALGRDLTECKRFWGKEKKSYIFYWQWWYKCFQTRLELYFVQFPYFYLFIPYNLFKTAFHPFYSLLADEDFLQAKGMKCIVIEFLGKESFKAMHVSWG